MSKCRAGRSKPVDRKILYDCGNELSPQNHALFWSHELLDAAQLDQRISECNVHPQYQRQAHFLLKALGLAEDRSFFRQMAAEPMRFPFVLRYAWLFCRFANCDEHEINFIFPTKCGFVDETHENHRAGIAGCKQEIADVVLRNGLFKYEEHAYNLVRVARESCVRHAAPMVKRAKTS